MSALKIIKVQFVAWRACIRNILLFILVEQFLTAVQAGGDLGNLECINGKWQVDTKIISLVVVCPVQISWDSLMCIFKRLGLYEDDTINPDFHVYLCTLLTTRELIRFCIEQFNGCLQMVGGAEGVNPITMFPVGACIWKSIHDKMNCTL